MNIDRLRKQEETHYKARVLGASEVDIARFEQVAQQFGPRTTLMNTECYEAIWFVGINSLMQGRPLIPTNAERWAGEVWLRLCSLMIIRSWEVGPLFEIKKTAEALWSAAASAPHCARCNQPLNNVSPGYSVVAGGQAVCANCLRPGEEIARAREI